MEKITLGPYSVKVLDPKILVFENAIDFSDELINFYEEKNEWVGWYGFGIQSAPEGEEFGYTIKTNNFPSDSEWDSVYNRIPENPFRDKIHKNFFELSKMYVEYTKTELPQWVYESSWCLAKYSADVNHSNNDEVTMGHHTDYQQDRHGQPGNKFGITAVYYPNDDYDGGEISFRILKPGSFTVEKEINYKPSKGDLIIFPSKDPYYHGVRRIWGNPKYIIRLYWTWDDPGLEDWHALRLKYGNEKFEELESQRLKRHDLLMYDPVQRPLLTFNQYYDLLERGLLPKYEGNFSTEEVDRLREAIINSDGQNYDVF